MEIVNSPEISLNFRILFALGLSVIIVTASAIGSYICKKQPKPSNTYLIAIVLGLAPSMEKLLHWQFNPQMALQGAIIIVATVALSQLYRLLPRPDYHKSHTSN